MQRTAVRYRAPRTVRASGCILPRMSQTLPTTPPTRPRLFSVAYGMAVVSVHCYFISYMMSLVEVPKALEGHPAWLIGLVVGVFGVAGMVTRPIVGVLVDRTSRQLWLRLGAAGTVIAFLGYALELGPWPTMIFRALHGVSMGAFTTSLVSIVGSNLPPERRGLGLGLYYMSNSVSGLYSAALAVWLFQSYSLQVAFLASALAAAGSLLFGSLAGPGKSNAPVVRTPGPRKFPLPFSPTALFPSLVFLAMTTPWGAVGAFLPLFAEDRGLGNPGLFYSAVALSQLCTGAIGGWISDRLGRSAVIIPALCFGALGLLLLSSAQHQLMFLGAGLSFGIGLGATQTATVALIVDRTPASGLGSGMATFTNAWDVGQVIGSIGLGVIAGLTSYAFVFGLGALSPLLGLLLFLVRVRPAKYAGQPAASP